MYTPAPHPASLPETHQLHDPPLPRRKPRQRREKRLTLGRGSVRAAPAGRVTFVDEGAGAVLALRRADPAGAHTARAGAFFDNGSCRRGVAPDDCGRRRSGDGAERQRGEEEGDGLVTHFDGSGGRLVGADSGRRERGRNGRGGLRGFGCKRRSRAETVWSEGGRSLEDEVSMSV